jgi:hypothetical protein
MSKELRAFEFSLQACEAGLAELASLLDSHDELSESRHILPFFSAHPQLAALAASRNMDLEAIDRIASEFDLLGDFRCDWVIGDHRARSYTLLEFEDARAGSVFAGGDRFHAEWGRRFEHGFSQLVDWFWLLDGNRRSSAFVRRFGAEPVEFAGVLVVGRDRFLSEEQHDRLRWRRDRVLIDSHKITCLTSDQLLALLDRRIRFARRIADLEDGD